MNSHSHLDFIVLTGDIGIEKLIKQYSITESEAKHKKDVTIIETDGKFFELKKDQSKWNQAVKTVSNIIAKSDTKLWLLVPGNNDLYDEISTTINFYADFVEDLKNTPAIKKSNIKIVDFRLEAEDRIGDFAPGTLKIDDNIFIGWDNSFFKNNYSVKHFLDKNHHLKPVKELPEYKSLKKLANTIKYTDAKSIYIFYHIPEVDDPWRVNFEVDPDDPDDNTITMTIRETLKLSPKFAKSIYPYSAWMVPLEIRNMWEKIITDINTPQIKGLFAGHFHDNKRLIYESFGWLRETRYKPEILSILHIAPSISIKNQIEFKPQNRARGGQSVYIENTGEVKVKHFWLENL